MHKHLKLILKLYTQMWKVIWKNFTIVTKQFLPVFISHEDFLKCLVCDIYQTLITCLNKIWVTTFVIVPLLFCIYIIHIIKAYVNLNVYIFISFLILCISSSPTTLFITIPLKHTISKIYDSKKINAYYLDT